MNDLCITFQIENLGCYSHGLRMLKKKAYMGQPKTQLILAAPVIINDTCQLPGFIVNLSPIVTTLKHLKKM